MGKKIHKPSIFQTKLQFTAGGATHAFNAEHPFENVALKTFTAALFVLIFSYIYLVGSSALNIIARKEAMIKYAQVNAVIGDFERDYFAASEKVTPEAGLSLGLIPVTKTAYVYRPGTVGRVAVANNEI
jgi:hypothetical protein